MNSGATPASVSACRSALWTIRSNTLSARARWLLTLGALRALTRGSHRAVRRMEILQTGVRT